MCKLYGIADQVNQDLTQAPRIAHERFRNIGIQMANQFQLLLLSPESHRFYGFFDAVSQIEVDRIQLKFSRLNFGKIKHVID